METETDVAALRDRVAELERRRADASVKLAGLTVPGRRHELETLRFELAEVAWRLDELADLAW